MRLQACILCWCFIVRCPELQGFWFRSFGVEVVSEAEKTDDSERAAPRSSYRDSEI